jgi:hypothetical protein
VASPFLLRFEESVVPSAASSVVFATMTKTGSREEPDQDPGNFGSARRPHPHAGVRSRATPLATGTFTEAREEADQDAAGVGSASTMTRTRTREEPDQDASATGWFALPR